MAQGRDDASVLVVGAGPTGLTAAVELARRGVDVRIVDAEPAPVEESRALAVQPRTLEVWLDEGVAQRALDRGIRVEAFNIALEGRDPTRVPTTGMGGPFGQPLILPQDETEQLLTGRLAELGVEVDRPAELTRLDPDPDGGPPTAHIDTPEGHETAQPDWLVGADGAHSTVRHALELPFEGVPYPDRFAIADADVDTDLATDELHAWIHEGRLLLLVPLRRPGHFRVITTHQPGDAPDRDPDTPPSHEELQALVDARTGAPITLAEPRWTSLFRVHCRGVPSYRVGRVLLAGDAAHIHSPAGGLGMNTGIQDAHNLGFKLALVARSQADPRLLETYHAERHPVGQRVLNTTDRLFQLAASDSTLARLARRYLAPPLLATATARDRLRRTLSQRDIAYPDSPLSGPDEHGSGPSPGQQAPDGELVGPDGASWRLLELLAEDAGHTLLAFAGTPAPASLAPVREMVDVALERAPGILLAGWVLVPNLERANAPVVGDPDGGLHATYERSTPGYEVIRPDGHIAARSDGLGLEALEGYLGRLQG